MNPLALLISEQKVKVPPQCDSRVQTISADVLNFPRQKLRELSPQVIRSYSELFKLEMF